MSHGLNDHRFHRIQGTFFGLEDNEEKNLHSHDLTALHPDESKMLMM